MVCSMRKRARFCACKLRRIFRVSVTNAFGSKLLRILRHLQAKKLKYQNFIFFPKNLLFYNKIIVCLIIDIKIVGTL